ncbi:MAG: ABC transporter ATP-binding protein [Armatimonadota bacterium]|nr:ABC transporter ATP-binding protein [Armatimonadota bacterium]MDR5697213.1 ABC transporter ATP-binding protein [Armatimonadota bacterium]
MSARQDGPSARGRHLSAVEVHDLRAGYGDVDVLRGVSVSIGHGVLAAVCGPNGAGKTTLLRCVAGLLRPWGGGVRVGGWAIGDLGPRDRARLLAYLPQDPASPVGFTCLEVVTMGRYAHAGGMAWSAADRQAAFRAMERTGTAHLARRPFHQTSGGERQRVLLSRALAQGARVLVLDEPTAHLDIAHQVQAMRLLRSLCGEGITTIAAMHELNLAALFCDQIALLSDGRVVAHGPSAEVLTPGLVRKVYGAEALVASHPQTGGPVVLPSLEGQP